MVETEIMRWSLTSAALITHKITKQTKAHQISGPVPKSIVRLGPGGGRGGANEAQVGRNNLIHIDPHRLEGGRKRTNPPKSNQRTTTTHKKKKKKTRDETNR